MIRITVGRDPAQVWWRDGRLARPGERDAPSVGEVERTKLTDGGDVDTQVLKSNFNFLKLILALGCSKIDRGSSDSPQPSFPPRNAPIGPLDANSGHFTKGRELVSSRPTP